VRRIAQRIACLGVLHRDERADVAGAHFVDFLGGVGLHFHDAAHALFLATGDVLQGVALLDHARVDAAEGQRAELVVDDLERQRARRCIVAYFLLADDVAVLVDHRDTAVLARVGHVVDHGVEQLLHALVLVRRAAEYRYQLAGDAALADAFLQQFEVGSCSPAFDQFLERVVVHRQRGFQHFLAQLGSWSIQSLSTVEPNFRRALASSKRNGFPGAVLVVRPRCRPRWRPGRPCREFVVAAQRDLAEQGRWRRGAL
jgi:hypothetical protein